MLQLIRIDPTTGLIPMPRSVILVLIFPFYCAGVRSIILEEKTTVWINLHELLTPLSREWAPSGVTRSSLPEGDFYFLWASERTGFMQLYLYRYDSLAQKGVNETGDVPIGGGGNWVVER